MKPGEREYYVAHGKISDPGERARLLSAMPSDPERVVSAVSALVLHRLFVAALDVPRTPERRFIGICRDYTLLACAVLRQHGVPARARVGFANYFTPNFNEDHWVCEYHGGDRWRLLDPELSERVRAYFKIPFTPSDV